jgi:hypothetical protein
MPKENSLASKSGGDPPGASKTHISAGPQALAAMASLLGIEELGGGWKIEGLCALGQEHARLSLKKGDLQLVVYILPPAAAEAQVRAAKLSLATEAGTGTVVRRFLKAMASRLGGRTLSDVLRLIEKDPQSFVDHLDLERPGDRIRVPCIGQPLNLLDDGWRNFYADQDFELIVGVPECLPEGTVNIEYTDIECHYARPRRSFQKWNFVDWPEVGQDETRHEHWDSNIVTELTERDMILGTGESSQALVDEARRIAADGKFLVFIHLCTPIVMGEDFQGLARRCAKEVGGTTVHWSQKDRDTNDNFGKHFQSLFGKPGFFAAPADAAAVNLFHFPAQFIQKELAPFLYELGVKINICVFPDIDLRELHRLPRALWQIFCERSFYPTKIRELLMDSPRKVVSARAPYGLALTRECLRGIAAAVGKNREFEKAWRRRMAGFLPSWELMRRAAAAHRLAFVVSEATLPRLLQLRYGQGAPLATMVREMGFGIDLLYYDVHGEAPQLPEGLRDARVVTFRSPCELDRALREGAFQAVFSDIYFDWRISRSGKARFSSRDFEMGLEGAMRTLRRLLSRCRLPFYRRYASHLARFPRKVHAQR